MTGDPGGLLLHLEKVLQAPKESVFAACVDPEKLAAWWGPAGFTTHSVDLDVRDGGGYRPVQATFPHTRAADLAVA